MPALTRSRIDEICMLAEQVSAAMRRGHVPLSGDRLTALAAAVTEVNAGLAEIDELLLGGLRDEALSMHDPELVTVARLLDFRSHSGWISLHGWLLERGQPPPAPVNMEAAEHFVATGQETTALGHELLLLRRLALERGPVRDRLAVLRRLRSADPANQAWVDQVASHEESRLRELRLAVPRALELGDIDELAVLSEELADSSWEQSPPADLWPLTAGAVEARALSTAAGETRRLASELASLTTGVGPDDPRQIDAADEIRRRFDDLQGLGRTLLDALAAHPPMLALVRARGLDASLRDAAVAASPAIQQVAAAAATLKTTREFEAACQRLDHLCDHPPETGSESGWLVDVQRYELVARAACQQLPQLVMPPLLRERVRRAAVAVETRAHLRRRFWVFVGVAAVSALLVVTVAGGWLTWSRSDYSAMLDQLKDRVSEARAGMHLERPGTVDRIASRHADDSRVATLIEEFEAGVAAEKSRVAAFNAHLADHAERLEDLAADLADREAAGAARWLDAWPESYVAAASILGAARKTGGLPANRGAGDTIPAIPVPAQQRFQAEENVLAAAEARQADLDRSIERLALRSFNARLSEFQDLLAKSEPDPRRSRELLAEVRSLRERATSPKATGMPAENTGQRVTPEAVANLEGLEKKLVTLARESGGASRGEPK